MKTSRSKTPRSEVTTDFMASSNKLVYHSPALEYDKSSMRTIMGMPLGNGIVGAIFYGKPGNEILALNHNRLWRNKIDKTIRTADVVHILQKDCLAGNATKRMTVCGSDKRCDKPCQYSPAIRELSRLTSRTLNLTRNIIVSLTCNGVSRIYATNQGNYV